MAQRVVVACAVAALCGCSPYGGGEFACTTDDQCGAGGKCAAGFCAFPDSDCTDSGFRYGELSGPHSGECVGGDQDGGVDTPDGPSGFCYGTGLVTACFASAPTNTQTYSNTQQIDTDSTTMCATTVNQVDACVVAAQMINVNSGVIVGGTGSRPLVLVATQTITINGILAVGSSRTFNFVGAGVDMAGCNTGTNPTVSSGGAGGSFGGAGGNGAVAGGGAAGVAGAPITVTSLRGGCSGQAGADNAAPMDPGERGRGGGAVYLIAEMSITVGGNGAIAASGGAGGGGGASAGAGAGGGGSGGFIGLDTPMIANAGSIFANGGAGGEGSGTMSTGNDGQDSTSATAAAIGGNGGSNFGTDGGNGSVGATLTGSQAAAACTAPCTTPTAGGGGGGGAGVIKHYRAPSIGGNVSPPAT